ncbi:phthiotriol/phenolphthiotriol dimycocerosates methyltransferase [Mycobacterium spongiae]|uniref:Methyltransferase domain-containing protein n=1 Tax=Mycobacterium spongiae TaxID=886343 RepID=A0A975PX12_9MYCO|nr:class I SAM-dependent methyltransferase [Mycobacterium spongiae]QUR67334.1 methyltransferase domain-containing protein [Mycobacterium spongiae]
MTIPGLTVISPLPSPWLTTSTNETAGQKATSARFRYRRTGGGCRDLASNHVARRSETCTGVLIWSQALGGLPACLVVSCDTLPVALRYRLQSNPIVGKLTTKYFLPLGTRQVGDDVVFFNFGYEEDPPMALPLDPADEPNRYGIQLYHQTASQVDLTGKRVLEVSCGAGGGASYIVRNLGPASYTGLDLNPASIELCREKHKLPGLDFVQGDAQNLPFGDETFDAVLNVEASHQYPDFPGFLGEVARVLRPGGHFLYTDSRRNPVVPEWEAALAAGPLKKISERDIDTEAKRGLDANTNRSQEAIGRRTALLARLTRYAVGVLDWDLRRGGGFTYRIYLFVKE